MSPSTVSAHEKREFASELKFLVDAATAERVRAWAREHLAADPNAGGAAGDTYHVTSLYFDTPDFAIFHRRGWMQHSKFRIRNYSGGIVFLERKLKVSGRVTKRRTLLTPQEFAQLDRLPANALWFAQKTAARRLRPVCQIDYRRTARVTMTPAGPIRLTLDEAICAVPASEQRFSERPPLPPLTDRIVLELKFRRDLPFLFRELVSRFTLNPQSFSKYRTAVQALGLVSPAELAALPQPAPQKVLACRSS
jgi:inorganic triphosphatase YgiF